MRAVEIFIAYSHNDLSHKNELKKFLRPLINTGQARVWDDYEIEGGQDWEAEIKKRLYGADIILLLVSPDSLASDYFYGQEVTVSLQRHDKGEAAIIPVILRPCTWILTPLKRLEALPEKGRPVTSWASQDEAYTDIAHNIGSIVETRQAVIAAASRLDEQRRNFSAAAEAAEHLFHKKQWDAAQQSFASALQLHQPGFSPERAALENRMAACAAEILGAALDARKKEYESLLDAAEYTTEPKQLAQILQKAIQLYQPGFPGNVDDLRQRLQAARTIPRTVFSNDTETDSGSGATGSNNRYLLPAAVAIALLLIALFAYRQCSGGNNKPGKPEPEQPQQETPATPAIASFLVKIPGGTFAMGDQFGDVTSGELSHNVTLSDFYLSKYEVSFDEFDAFCNATQREKPSDNSWGRGKRPAINVDWYDAIEYCNWLSGQHGLRAVYTIDRTTKDPNNANTNDSKKWMVRPDWSANGYRLPTEAEWEYAARGVRNTSGVAQGGGKVRFSNGRDIIDPTEINFNASKDYKQSYSIVGEYREKTVPVDELSANIFGLKNMSGNVWEWCGDWYDSDFYKKSKGARDPKGGGSGEYRVLRGGSWDVFPMDCRASVRSFYGQDFRIVLIGFRVARHL